MAREEHCMLNKFNTISTDSLRTDVIMAKRVLWCSEGVTNPENLLTNQEQQAPTNDFLLKVEKRQQYSLISDVSSQAEYKL